MLEQSHNVIVFFIKNLWITSIVDAKYMVEIIFGRKIVIY